jgi:hypothetical protein
MDALDIWRAANQMLRRYNETAAMEAAKRSNAALNVDDQGGYEIWQRIMSAITELQRTKRMLGDGLH